MNGRHLRLNISNIFIYIALIFCFEPKIFVKNNTLNALFIIGALLVFFTVTIQYFSNNTKISNFIALLILYRLSFIVQTVLARGDILMWGYMSIVLITLAALTEMQMERDALNYLKKISNVLLLYLIINLIVSIKYPNGIIKEIYFIGIRTRTTDVIFPAVCLALIIDWMQSVKFSFRLVLTVLVSVALIVRLWIATALVGCGLFILLLIIAERSKLIAKCINLRSTTYMGPVLSYCIVVLRIQNIFAFIIEGMLHKRLTLSGRTEIWDIAIQIIKPGLLFGYGMRDNGNFVPWAYTGDPISLWQGHNQWVQILYDGGLITLFVLVAFIAYPHGKMKRYTNFASLCLSITNLVFMIMMITEIYTYTPYYFLIPIVGYSIDRITQYKEGM